MNTQHVKGGFKQAKGKVKEEVGHATGSSKTAAKGVAEQVAGKAQKAWGDLKDKVKEKVDRALADKPSRTARH